MTRTDRLVLICKAIEAVADPDALARLQFGQYIVLGAAIGDLMALDEWPDDRIVVEVVQQYGLARPAPTNVRAH